MAFLMDKINAHNRVVFEGEDSPLARMNISKEVSVLSDARPSFRHDTTNYSNCNNTINYLNGIVIVHEFPLHTFK